MAGNSIEQYRAAIGFFYCRIRCTQRLLNISIFLIRELLVFLQRNFCHWGNLCKICLSCLTQYSVFIGYYFQILFMLLILSGDVETNPGPNTGTQYTLDIFHLNIRSIRNKIDSLLSLVTDFDVLCFTESHLDSCITDQNLLIDGFNTIYRKDRNSFGGGIIIYVSNSLRVKRRTDLEPTNIECI